jgi:hypothetical protein
MFIQKPYFEHFFPVFAGYEVGFFWIIAFRLYIIL